MLLKLRGCCDSDLRAVFEPARCRGAQRGLIQIGVQSSIKAGLALLPLCEVPAFETKAASGSADGAASVVGATNPRKAGCSLRRRASVFVLLPLPARSGALPPQQQGQSMDGLDCDARADAVLESFLCAVYS